MLSTGTLKKKLYVVINNLRVDDISNILSYAEYVRDKEEWVATREIHENKKMVKAIEIGLKQARAGKTISWEEVQKRCSK